MKVLGYLRNQERITNTYMVVVVNEAYTTGTDDKRKVYIYSTEYNYSISHADGGYLTKSEAQDLVRNIAYQEVVDLELYDMALCNMEDKWPIAICNAEDYEYSPLRVQIVEPVEPND